MAPSLASWNKATDPDQLRLSRYLEHVVETASPYMTDDVPLAADMCVGLPAGLPLTGNATWTTTCSRWPRSSATPGSIGVRIEKAPGLHDAGRCAVRPCRT